VNAAGPRLQVGWAVINAYEVIYMRIQKAYLFAMSSTTSTSQGTRSPYHEKLKGGAGSAGAVHCKNK